MPRLHDPTFRTALRSRLQSLTPNAQRQWGKMTAEQMVWHINRGMEIALGRVKCGPQNPPLPKAVMRFLVLNLPWPKEKGPALPEMLATGKYDFGAERAKSLKLIDEVAGRDLNASWPYHPVLGGLSGPQWSWLQAKHVDYHLRQFSA